MARWDRSTPWRQGHILKPETLALLEIPAELAGAHTVAVVASHDCDLSQAADSEPNVEVVLGRIIDGPPDGNYTNCKNLRTLHITSSGGTQTTLIELDTRLRILIPKELLSGGDQAPLAHEPSTTHSLSSNERNTLQIWLAARYRRSAFPDEFDRRLKSETRMADALAKALKDTGNFIPAIFFDVDNGTEQQRQGANDPYELAIIVLYATDEDPEKAEQAALATKASIENAFKKRCQIEAANGAETWHWIELVDVIVTSDVSLSYAHSVLLKKWQADHISLRTDPPQPTLVN